jgi:competence protein ComEC
VVGPILVAPLAEPRPNAAAVARWTAGMSPAPRQAVAVTGDTQGHAGTDGWSVRWQVPATHAASSSGDAADSVVNDTSLVLLADLGTPDGARARLIALGDLETGGQRSLARLLNQGDMVVDVVKVAHHGSAKQEPRLYQRLGARVALIGVGAGNDYGHPAPATLSLLARQGTRAMRTDLDGTVTLGLDRAPSTGSSSSTITVTSRGR